MSEIQLFNRYTNKLEKEKIYGESFMRWAYSSFSGKIVMGVVPLKLLSQFFGTLQDTKYSTRKIDKFVKDFDICMDDFLEEEGGGYSSFNSFFERKFAPGKREFVKDSNLAAFSESRYFGHEKLTKDERVPVKGYNLSMKELIGDDNISTEFLDGPVLIGRLAPVDYHRFHFPDSGRILKSYRVKGQFESVSPVALEIKKDILIKNERQVTILETDYFGKLAYIEVGAVCVGKIVQTYRGDSFTRGEEKGTFLFGGSTVIVVGKKGVWKPSDDIIENSNKGIETYVKLGDRVGGLV
jgi:phosphatidylserine decarboxylase